MITVLTLISRVQISEPKSERFLCCNTHSVAHKQRLCLATCCVSEKYAIYIMQRGIRYNCRLIALFLWRAIVNILSVKAGKGYVLLPRFELQACFQLGDFGSFFIHFFFFLFPLIASCCSVHQKAFLRLLIFVIHSSTVAKMCKSNLAKVTCSLGCQNLTPLGNKLECLGHHKSFPEALISIDMHELT